MARIKLSEYQTKRLLFPTQLVLQATTKTTTSEINAKLAAGHEPNRMVVKVDQGIKKRGIRGLVKVGVGATLAVAQIRKWADEWSQFLIEPLVTHAKKDEKYLSLERGRSGWVALASDQGGIDIESNWDTVTSVDPAKYQSLITKLEEYHLATLELNPYILRGHTMLALDAAAEIDDAALGLPEIQRLSIVPVIDKSKAPIETAIAALDASTPASLKFKLINGEGRIWMLLSGGGASLVLSDEVADQGMGPDLANYGEYSGAPKGDDVYSYTKLILKELLKNKKKKKALVIAAGIANFTDVAKTFKGIIRAMEEKHRELKQAGVKVFVRRGGPNEAKGLALMREFLSLREIPHVLHFHDHPLTEVITEVKEYLS